ncbi:MAG: FAD:protein FMN transferase [Planctomycetota bacterium]
MGTSWKAVVLVPGGQSSARLGDVIQGDLDAVDRAMSTWKDDSDLSRFNRSDVDEAVEVSDLTLDVVRLCRPWVEATGGAFDPTVGPLVRAWGFGSYEEVEAPSDEEIEEARGLVDFGAIEVREKALLKTRDGVELDVSAVAKGHAVDLAAASLIDAGCTSFLLEVGGEMVLRGQNSQGGPWRVGIDDPLPPEGSDPVHPLNFAPRPPYARLALGNHAVATSGDYRNVREVNGRIVAHAIDPRSGRPIDHDLASVTVVAATCAEADALATAALVLGPEAGLELLDERPGVEAYLLVRTVQDGRTQLSVRMTNGMAELVMPEVPAGAPR